MKRLAYLGPQGTFSEEVALLYDATSEQIGFPSIRDAVAAVEQGTADEAIVPIENSEMGAVIDTVDLLIHDSALTIAGELAIPIHHCLIGKPGARVEDIRLVRSKPQALEQCRRYFRERLSNVEQGASMSTAGAVEEAVKGDGSLAAIASKRAAKLYGGAVIEENIEDNPNNVTRFVVLAAKGVPPTGDDKTSIGFSFDGDAPGLIYSVLGEFATRSINLTKIESRPTRQRLGRYVFLIDFLGHQDDPPIRETLDSVRDKATMLKVFGSYPRYRGYDDA